MKTKIIILFVILNSQFSILNSAFSQTFERAYGGTRSETGTCIQHTPDGNYIMSGTAGSFTNGYNDAYLLKVDPQGTLLWSKTYGGTADEHGYYVSVCSDGGFILTGSTNSFGSGNSDLFLIKTDSDGNHQWSTAVGGTGDDYGWYALQTADGGFIATGATNSYTNGSFDGYLVKVNSSGALQWTKVVGGTGGDFLNGMSKTSDGGYIVTGTTSSNSFGSSDIWLMKFDSNGDTLWTKQFGRPTEDAGNAVIQSADGGYVIAGDSHTYTNSGAHRAVLAKTDSQGNLLWEHVYGSYPGAEIAYDVLPAVGNGYFLLCYSGFFGNGNKDVLLIRADNTGKKIWAKTYGSSADDDPWYFQQASDGELMIAAATSSFGAGQSDVFLVRTDSSGSAGCFETSVDPFDTVPVFQVRSGTVIISGGIASAMNTVVTIANTQLTDPCPVSVNEINNENVEVNVYPNPFSETATVEVTGDQSSVTGSQFILYDMFGKELRRLPITGYQLLFLRGGLPAGIYFYRISTSSSKRGEGSGGAIIATGKIVVE